MQQNVKLRAILDKGRTFLDKGDVAGYWKHMSQVTDYARLAGDVASGNGLFAHLANQSLQRAARARGRSELSRKELAQISADIARKDLDFRKEKFDREGHIGLTDRDIFEYHKLVFEDHNLPEDTFIPANLQKLGFTAWSALTGNPTADAKRKDLDELLDDIKRKHDENPEQFRKTLMDLGGDFASVARDTADFYADEIEDMLPEPDDKPFRLDDANQASREGGETKEKRVALSGVGGNTALTGDKAAADPAATSPEARKFLDDVVKPGSPADEILLKPVSRWTDDELGVVMGTRLDLPSGGHPERNRMADKETEFFKRFHSDGTTPPIPKDPTPARAPDGGDLASALRRVGAHVVRTASKGGLPPALRDLQRGINLKRDAAMALKVDGAFGPRTHSALRRATADQGSAGVERLFALGRFHGFAEDAERDGPADLKDTLEAVFADPGRTPARPVGALKRTLNNLGQIHFGGDAWRPLDDGKGRIGPETTTAFAKVLRAAGPKLLTERFGRFLGIL